MTTTAGRLPRLEVVAGTIVSFAVPAGVLYAYALQPGGVASMTANAMAFWLLSAIGGLIGFIGSLSQRAAFLWVTTGMFVGLGVIGFFSVSVLLLPAAVLFGLLAFLDNQRKQERRT